MSTTLTKKKWVLERYEKQDYNIWKEVNIDTQRCYLTLDHPQLLLEDRGVVLYSVDLSEAGKTKIHYANANIGIKTIFKNGKTSKIRIRLRNGNKTGSDYCKEVVSELKDFVPVVQHVSHIERKPIDIVKQNLPEVLNNLSGTSNRPTTNIVEPIIQESDMKVIIDAFVLHPQFPTKIVEIWEQFSSFK